MFITLIETKGPALIVNLGPVAGLGGSKKAEHLKVQIPHSRAKMAACSFKLLPLWLPCREEL